MPTASRAPTAYASLLRFLGAELRWWRDHRGMSAAALAQQVYVCRDLILKVEKAKRVPTADLIDRCDSILGTGGALRRLLGLTNSMRTAPEPSEPPVAIVVQLVSDEGNSVVEPVAVNDSGTGEVRVYQLSINSSIAS